ncbi:type VI secretion system contractile sheath domain-containing protein [Vibrio sp. NTOU-M3]|uniref:type VI secretion system contractile sheath domain-containing protein n=1 Tax=Vibrio sp. NTOU-M3 TaxID=3234954 RepID=UPI00349F175D
MRMMLNTNWQEKFNQLDSKDNAFLAEALSLLACIPNLDLTNKQQLIAAVSRLITELDSALSKQLDNIMHDRDFVHMESNWRGIQGLALLPINAQRTQLKILDMSWNEVSSDMNQAYNIRACELYNKIGNQELNTLGGHPFGCIMFTHAVSMDIDVDADFDDLFTLELLGKLGESTLCPIVLSPDEHFFVNSGADWISDITRIEKILSGPDYQAWEALRAKASSRFTALVMPRIRMRSIHHNAQVGFLYNESGNGLWGNACFAFIASIMREHHRVNWFGFLKSRWNDKFQGALINLPNSKQQSEYLSKPVTDITLFGQVSTFYAQHGFIPLTKSQQTNTYYFNGNNSVWRNGNNDNDKVLNQVQTTLMSCRIAHYLKVQVREMIGSFNTAAECELFLTQWIEKFSSNVTNANEETLAKYPLSFAKISVEESHSAPGSFACTLRMVPQYQYDHFSGEVVLTTELDEVA